MGEEPLPYNHREIAALIRSVDSLRKAVEELPAKIAANYITREVAELRFQSVEDDIKKHDDWIIWSLRLIVGFIVVFGLGALITLAAQQGAI